MTHDTKRISARLRRAVRALDAWTLTAFNPQYPVGSTRS